METVTTRDFRSNMAAVFNKVDAGEQILVKRNERMYTIVPVENDGLEISQELWARIEKSRKEIAEGKCYVSRNEEELKAFFESL